jgi:hypothetical protein
MILGKSGFLSFTVLLVTATWATRPALQAEGPGGFYGGGGVAYTDFRDRTNDSRWGYRLYGGFDFFEMGTAARFSGEGGFMQTGSFKTEGSRTDRYNNIDLGIQSALTVFPTIDLHARLGFELGDNTGLFYAFGIAVDTAITNTFLRAEFQRRDDFNTGILGLEIRLP